MDVTCEFCLDMNSRLPQLGSSKVLFSIIVARFHDAGHVDPDDALLRSMDLIVEMAGLRLEVAWARQQLLSKEVEFLDKRVALCTLLTTLGLASFSDTLDASSGTSSGSASDHSSDSDEGLVDNQ